MQGQSGVDFIKKFDTEKFSVKFAAEVKDFDPLNYIEKKEARKMGALHTLRYRGGGRGPER